MMRNIVLHGDLGKFIGHKNLEAKVSTVAECVRFLITNFPQAEAYMAKRYYKVILKGEDINQDELHNPIGQAEINIVPVISGAGGNFGKIFLGVALIGASFLFPGAGMFGTTSLFGAGAGAGIGTTIGTALSAVGAVMVLQGVSGMLFPLPEEPDFSNEGDPRISFNFSGTQNTSRAGTPVPIVYGEIFTGSVVISAAIDTEQVQA